MVKTHAQPYTHIIHTQTVMLLIKMPAVNYCSSKRRLFACQETATRVFEVRSALYGRVCRCLFYAAEVYILLSNFRSALWMTTIHLDTVKSATI